MRSVRSNKANSTNTSPATAMNLHLLPLSDTWVLPRPFAPALRRSPLSVRQPGGATKSSTASASATAAPSLWQTSLAEIERARRFDRVGSACAAVFGLLVAGAVAVSGVVTAGLLGPRGIEFVVHALLLK